jgi:predicted O-methyltransferase YrrM
MSQLYPLCKENIARMLIKGTTGGVIMTTNRLTSTADSVLEEIENRSQRMFWPIIGPLKGKYLVETVKEYDIKKVLEVGTLVGYSAILIAKNLPEDGRVTTIEINPHSAELAEANIRRVGMEEKIRIRVGNAIDVITQLNEKYDMVFIDAAKNEYLDYLKLAENKLRKNGVVFADNVKIFANQMQDYLEYVRNSGRYQSRFIDVGFDGVEISLKLF